MMDDLNTTRNDTIISPARWISPWMASLILGSVAYLLHFTTLIEACLVWVPLGMTITLLWSMYEKRGSS